MKTLVKSDVLAPLFHLQTLIFLDISYNGHIQGEIPGVGLANLTNLVRLYMAGNSLIGSLPPQLFSLRRLEYLDQQSFWSNSTITDAFDKVRMLDLGHNFFTMEIPTDIGNLSNISYLSLRENNFSGEIPPSIQKMEELEVADLCDNNLEGTLPQWLADTDIKYLLLSNNKFSGSLPPHLFQSQSFLALILIYNLSGALPETIGEASRMKILILSSNRFFGTVPPSISKLGLRLLDLSCNKFSGNEFPIFNPNSSLAYIDFSFNKLSGEVPVTFPLVVKVLLLNENEFSGVLPQEIAKFSQLQYLNLQSNNLEENGPKTSTLHQSVMDELSANFWCKCGWSIPKTTS
ncbi:hypothetical protein GH714_005142 [Hevea brasiliensis]|uniref:Leucine-rich repeat-containing N-terminal plant-type domain-containing protein n=1 Tax=Hevea brasiliensis TaxID=3981 RepID=A0A6A6KLA7_HEVBR|nr:hypothetical protein GH714_005142 [Hevea brasiliensis]